MQRLAGAERLFLLLFLAAVILFGCEPYQLKAVLDGPQGTGLSISPSATAVAVSSTFTFTASGGVGPYTYVLLSGGGSVDPVTGVYTAPAIAGSAVIRVTDTTDRSVDAVVTVDLPSDCKVSFDPNIPWSGVVGNVMSITGTTKITIQNVSTNPGHANITWSVYLSADNFLDPGDTLIQQGIIGPLAAGASAAAGFTGTWPAASGVYYLITAIQASDDSNVANNVVIGHLTAVGDYRYQEGAEDNSSVGTRPPAVIVPPAGPTSDTATVLWANQTLVIEGVMDAFNQDDTYAFSVAGVSSLTFQTLWVSGFDDIDT